MDEQNDSRWPGYYRQGLESAAAVGLAGEDAKTYARNFARGLLHAVIEDNKRITAILNHDLARGREQLAKFLALNTSTSIDDAIDILAVTPKQGRLDALMNSAKSPRTAGEDPDGAGDQSTRRIDADQVYANRRKLFKGNRND